MDNRAKLIMLGGFAGCGKTTIADKYVSEHPLSLSVEGDELITKLGRWRENIGEAVGCKKALTTAMIEAHLKRGYDVILPYLLRDAQDAEYFETLAHTHGADFYEVTLSVEKEEAIQRLFKRGTWGEEGLPPLIEADRVKAEELYDNMSKAINLRADMIYIQSKENDSNGTYVDFMAAINGV